MRWRGALVAAAVLPLAGCLTGREIGDNAFREPLDYLDRQHLHHRLRKDAQAAWADCHGHHPGRPHPDDFRDGFLDGYVDHLEYGGPPRPPAVPPAKYRRSKYLTPEGQAQAIDYLAGFQAGAEAAAASGKRQFLTVPVLLSDPRPDPSLNLTVVPTAEHTLPPPRPLPGGPPTALPGPVPVPAPVPAPVPLPAPGLAPLPTNRRP